MCYKKIHSMIFLVLAILSFTLNYQMTASALPGNKFTPGGSIDILYNDKNGLPTSEANAVLQTKDGYIWIGSYGGLIRYDGNELKNYSINGEIPITGIRALFEDEGNRLLVGTNDKGVFCYENGVFEACQIPDGANFKSVRCFAQGENGEILVGTSAGLARLNAKNELEGINVKELENQTIYSLSIDQNGVLWGTAGSGFIFALRDGKLLYWFSPGELSKYENYIVLADGDKVYIGTSGDVLLRLTLIDNRYRFDSYTLTEFSTGTIQTVNALFLDAQSNLWLGSNTGAGWFDSTMQLHMPDGSYTFISMISGDYEGNIWLASTQSGIYHLTSSKFRNANRRAKLSGLSVNAVMEANGLLYVATDSGLSIVDDDWLGIRNDLTEMLSGIRLRHVMADSKGRVWISSYSEHGLICYTPATGKIETITETSGLASNKVRVTLELQNGDIAVGTTAGLNIVRDGTVIECYGRNEGMENAMVLSLLQTQDGTLFAGSDGGGIYYIKKGELGNIGIKNGLDSGVVLRMREDVWAKGIWISAGSDLYFLNQQGEVEKRNDFKAGIGSIFDIYVTQDYLWFMKSSGMIGITRSSLDSGKAEVAQQYGAESGLPSNITANSWNYCEDDTFYLCTADGVYLLDIKNISPNNVPPKIAVNQMIVEDKNGEIVVWQNPSNIVVPSSTRRITIHFACLSYTKARGSCIYEMEGFDLHPVTVSAGQAGVISYTNLPGGNYVFRLSGVNADGVPSDGDVIVAIEKQRMLTEMPAFWVAAMLIFILCVFLISRLIMELKLRVMRHRQQEYKAITEQSLRTIAKTIDAKDKYTNGHSLRVAELSKMLAARMRLSEEEQENIYYMALLHDIGKIGIPDAILNKPGKLTDEEFRIMKEHTHIGSDILRDFTSLPQIGSGAIYHHERYDGKGYPEQKQGQEIPLIAQIIGVADAYDAMATKRSYKDPMDRNHIRSEFEHCSGTQFSPYITQIMIELMDSEEDMISQIYE